MLDLVIITGATKGIGNKILENAANYGKNIIAIGSSNLVEDLKVDSSVNFIPLKLDFENPIKVETAIKEEITKIKGIQSIGLALCAAKLGNYGGLEEAKLDEWTSIYNVNVLGNLAVLRACLPLAQAGARYRAVMFAGGGAAYGYPEFSAYATSKAALVRAVENLAIEFERKLINGSIVALAPGAVQTDMLMTVIKHGGTVKTKTDVSEPVQFVKIFLNDEIDVRGLNGRFIHVRDEIKGIDFSKNSENLFKLRRVE